jgi:hypothetical protein
MMHCAITLTERLQRGHSVSHNAAVEIQLGAHSSQPGAKPIGFSATHGECTSGKVKSRAAENYKRC